MKISLALSALILLVGLTMGLIHRKEISVLRENQNALLATAAKLGIPAEEQLRSSEQRVTKRQRDERTEKSGSMVSEIIAFVTEKERLEAEGVETSREFENRGLGMGERMMALDPDQMRSILAELQSSTELSDEGRKDMIAFSMMILAKCHPASALAFYVESNHLIDDNGVAQIIFTTALGNWAKDDPRAALHWLEQNSAEHQELSEPNTQFNILAGAAEKDPKLAFQLLEEMKLTEPGSGVQAIMESAKNLEQRAAALAAFRAHLGTVTDEAERESQREEALGGLARSITGESFDSLTGWIASQKLTPAESQEFSAGLSYDTTKAETGRWIDWMANTLPPEKLNEQVSNLVSQWTQQDYLAAGKWLAAEQDGAAKSASVRAYAETVAEYEPQTAAQWALTLPPGPDRDETLRNIYQSWPKNDQAAAAAFAIKYNIPQDAAKEEP